MKRIVCFLFLFFILIDIVKANDKVLVKFSDCVDGDTAKFVLDSEVITVRFLAIDTPEVKHPTKGLQAYGKEASAFTCDKLMTSSKIYLEFDENSEQKDKYERYLAWVFIDNNLLQNLIIEKGLAKVGYLYGDYKYTHLLKESEKIAKDNKLGIWSIEKSNDKNIILIIGIIVTVILFIFNRKYRKKSISKIKRNIKKKIKKLV